uniref:C-type lectin domain-containing protein n=1 Tax=Panagrolaimus sp. JU765 TaxID=591449 RepID=A0AC34RCQ1_9BILA
MDTTSGSWSSQPCSDSKYFVCQIPSVIDVCDSGWTYYYGYNPSCYKLFGGNNTYFGDAEQICIDNGAHLVSIESSADNEFIRKMIVPTVIRPFEETGVWIGYHYPKGWVDGSYYNYQRWYTSPSAINSYGTFLPDKTTDLISYGSYWRAVNGSVTFNRLLCKKRPTNYPYPLKN